MFVLFLTFFIALNLGLDFEKIDFGKIDFEDVLLSTIVDIFEEEKKKRKKRDKSNKYVGLMYWEKSILKSF